MVKIRWGIGGLTILWLIGVGLWAAVALARIARGEPVGSGTTMHVESRLPAIPGAEWSCARAREAVTLGQLAAPASQQGSGSSRRGDGASIRRSVKL